MKPASTRALSSLEPKTDFSVEVDRQRKAAEQMSAKSVTLRNRDIDYINAVAHRLSGEQRRQVAFSEALRSIIGGAAS